MVRLLLLFRTLEVNELDNRISYDIRAADGQKICVYGTVAVTLDFGFAKKCTWTVVVVADVSTSILQNVDGSGEQL